MARRICECRRPGCPFCDSMPTPRRRAVAVPSEHIEAVIFIRKVEGQLDTWPELAWLAAIPNGGLRHKREAAKLKAEGVKPGVPDYLLPVARGGYVGLALELKTATGRVSPEQKAWLAHLEAQGWLAVVARGWEQAWDVVRDYMAQEQTETAQDGVTGVGGVSSTPKNDRRPVQGHTGGEE